MDKIEITSITIVQDGGADAVIINTTLPTGCWPYDHPAHVKLQVARNEGENYVKKNFPNTTYEIINTGG